jgi:outer membrane protein TolC
MAQDDLNRAQASSRETEDFYIPSVVASGGAGASHGILLTVPTIFTIASQSIVYSYSQSAYIKASKFDLQAASLALDDARAQVEEDVSVSYLTLSYATQIATALADELKIATTLQSIVQSLA